MPDPHGECLPNDKTLELFKPWSCYPKDPNFLRQRTVRRLVKGITKIGMHDILKVPFADTSKFVILVQVGDANPPWMQTVLYEQGAVWKRDGFADTQLSPSILV